MCPASDTKCRRLGLVPIHGTGPSDGAGSSGAVPQTDRVANQFPPGDSFDEFNSNGPDPEPTPEADSSLGGSDASGSVGECARPQHLDGSVRDLLRRLGLARCRADTSLVFTTYARGVPPELFEAVLDKLAEIQPLWHQLRKQRGTRIMDELLDEFVWVVRNLRCPHAPPSIVAEQLGVGMALDFGVVLANRFHR